MTKSVKILRLLIIPLVYSHFWSLCCLSFDLRLLITALVSTHFSSFSGFSGGGSPERTTDHGQATGKLYHLQLRVEYTLFVIYKAGRAVLVIGLYNQSTTNRKLHKQRKLDTSPPRFHILIHRNSTSNSRLIISINN
jgi:hypothetical protein